MEYICTIWNNYYNDYLKVGSHATSLERTPSGPEGSSGSYEKRVLWGAWPFFGHEENEIFRIFGLPAVVETNIDVGSDKIILSSNRPTMETQAIC